MLLGMENVAARMSRMAKNVMYYGRQVPIDEILQKLDAVTRDDVARMADRYFRRERTALVGLGPVQSLD